MIYFFPDEVRNICRFLNADYYEVMHWLETNMHTNKYIEFDAITVLGVSMYQVIYGRNASSTDKVVCHVSHLGTQFKDEY